MLIPCDQVLKRIGYQYDDKGDMLFSSQQYHQEYNKKVSSCKSEERKAIFVDFGLDFLNSTPK